MPMFFYVYHNMYLIYNNQNWHTWGWFGNKIIKAWILINSNLNRNGIEVHTWFQFSLDIFQVPQSVTVFQRILYIPYPSALPTLLQGDLNWKWWGMALHNSLIKQILMRTPHSSGLLQNKSEHLYWNKLYSIGISKPSMVLKLQSSNLTIEFTDNIIKYTSKAYAGTIEND